MVTKKEKAAQFADQVYDIHVTGRNIAVTDALRDYVIDKVSKIERISQRIIDVQVTMDKQKTEQRVDIVMKVGGILIKSHASTDNMYASIDKAVDKLQHQFKRYKTRLQQHHARPLEVFDMRVQVLRNEEAELQAINEAIEDENLRQVESILKPHEIVAHETMPLKVLTIDEAIMKMDLSGHVFLLFKEEKTRKLNLIYRRQDGKYAIMLPEG
jgi:putative sigma-54 modulation protein